MSIKRGSISRYVCTHERCPQSRHPFEQFCWHSDPMPACPTCGRPAGQFNADIQHQHGCDFYQPILSDSMGVHPSQVEEHRRVHPDIPITDDGRVVVKNHQEGKRIRKELGFFDKDGYSR